MIATTAVLLLRIIESEGLKLADKQDVLHSLSGAVYDGKIKFLRNREKKIVGFLTWTCDGKMVFVNNLLVLRAHKREFSFSKLRIFFKEMYPELKSCGWKNRRKQILKQFKVRGNL